MPGPTPWQASAPSLPGLSGQPGGGRAKALQGQPPGAGLQEFSPSNAHHSSAQPGSARRHPQALALQPFPATRGLEQEGREGGTRRFTLPDAKQNK